MNEKKAENRKNFSLREGDKQMIENILIITLYVLAVYVSYRFGFFRALKLYTEFLKDRYNIGEKGDL